MTMSGLILTACCIIIAIWDLVAVNIYGVNYSVSRFIQGTAIGHPLFLIALGVLIGHFFAAMQPVAVPLPGTGQQVGQPVGNNITKG